MKRSLPLLLSIIVLTSLAIACNKEQQRQLAELQGQKEAIESSVKEMAEAQQPAVNDFGITFDKEYYWIDAGGSVTLHYTLAQAASLSVSAGEGWSATIAPAGETAGDITVTAPDPAMPAVLAVKATGSDGDTTEEFLNIYIRDPFCNVASPRIEAMAYNGFSNELATEENFRKLVEAGITMISVEGDWDNLDWRRQCRLAEKVGLKVVLFINYTAGLYSDDPENFKGLDALVNEAKQYKAICAYQISDEPSTVLGPRLAVAKKRINELDPEHPVYINLNPSGGSVENMGALTYAQYVEYFATYCDLEFITFDQYPVYFTGVQDAWYEALEVVSSTAKRHGVPFWAFLLCCREWYRAFPTLENIRLQGNMNLTYGAQCNQFFVWKATSGTDYAPIMNDGTYKPVYDQCKEYNREVHNREFIFAKGDVLKVRHIGHDYYIHGAYLTKEDLPEAISDISADGSAAVSFLYNNGNEYVIVCNKSWETKLTVDMDFTREVYKIDREAEFTKQGPGNTRFTIDEGDMLVVKWR